MIRVAWFVIRSNERVILPKTNGTDIPTIFICPVGGAHAGHAGTVRVVKFVAVGIEDVRGLAALRLRSLLPALAGGVVDGDAGLDVVHIDIEADAFPLVLHRPSLHLDTAGYQVLTLEHR